MDRAGSYHCFLMRKIVVLLAALALPSFGQIPLPTAPTKYVTDAAGVIPDDREAVLNERLAYFDRTTTHQVIVYVDRRVPEGTTLEEMSAEAIRTWAVGQEKRDNGAILFFFIDSRESRIEVGYGLEGTLTDAKSKRILVGMRPLLRSGDYAGAVEEGAIAILDTIAVEPPAPQPVPQPVAEVGYTTPVENNSSFFDFGAGCVLPFGLLIVVFVIVAMAKNGSFNNLNWPNASAGPPNDPWPPNNPPNNPWPSNDTSSSWSPSSFPSSHSSPSFPSSDSGSSSSSSSGFSGGGGSGGGGGASDKW
jgi:uncharacterized protein